MLLVYNRHSKRAELVVQAAAVAVVAARYLRVVLEIVQNI